MVQNYPGGDSTEDFTITVQSLSDDDPATIATIIDASIDTVTVTNGGSGYLSAPTITVSGGNGINAVLNATIQNQSVTSIGIESAVYNIKVLLLSILSKRLELVHLYYLNLQT